MAYMIRNERNGVDPEYRGSAYDAVALGALRAGLSFAENDDDGCTFAEAVALLKRDGHWHAGRGVLVERSLDLDGSLLVGERLHGQGHGRAQA